MTVDSMLPVAIIGAGPVGLAAAAHLERRGVPFTVLEASDGVAACFRRTAHVRLFSPWKMNIDKAAAALLEGTGWHAPDPEAMPLAGEVRTEYLEPLAKLFGSRVRYRARVESMSRRGFDKVKSEGREHAPFELRLRTPAGDEVLEARAVIDASGTWDSPNWLGANGLPARGEREHAIRIVYGMPDILGSARSRYANKRVLVVGAGHSAAGSLLGLSELLTLAPSTRMVWAVRGTTLERLFGGGNKDGLPERGRLGIALRALTDAGKLELHLGMHIDAVESVGDQLEVRGRSNGRDVAITEIDEIIVATGARPDLSIARELRLKLDPWIESTEQLAPLIDPNLHSCGSVPPHGHRELEHPERGYYAIGAKSYGRAPNFLLATGYEQARSVVAALAGDLASGDDVQLELPETGVCVTDLTEKGPGSGAGCCAPQAAERQPAATGCCGPEPTQRSGSCCG
jgi:thioredoxin reductase